MEFDPKLLQELITTFSTELEEQLQIITQGLLDIEANNFQYDDKSQTILKVIRAAHNIKGTSRSLGITSVSEIAHAIESLFSSIDKGAIQITSNVIDLCFDAMDKMRSAMESFKEKKPLSFDLADLLKQLDEHQSQTKQPLIKAKTRQSIDQEKHLKKSVIENLKEQDTMRVSLVNIERISTLLEEMQVNKIAIDDYYDELINIMLKIKQFGVAWKQILYFMKNQELNEGVQKLYTLGSDHFTEIEDDTFTLKKTMHARLNEFSLVFNALQEEFRTLRLVPFSNLLNRMPRYARDLSHELHKNVELDMKGSEVKIDKIILEKLTDPIIHIIRNSIDHGIENPDERKNKGKPAIGQITIDIQGDNNQILITITDDGAGMDAQHIAKIAETKKLVSKPQLEKMNESELINLIFMPGFSSKEIISDVSGRGLGLDIVKMNVTNLNGQISVNTELGKGTTFKIAVPLTLVSERGLVIASSNQPFVIPVSAVLRVVFAGVKDILKIEGCEAIMLDQHPVPLQLLSAVLGLPQHELSTQDQFPIVFIKTNNNTVALIVDELYGEREIVIKPFNAPLENAPYVAGGTLSGNNQVIIVLNPNEVINAVLKPVALHEIKFSETNVAKIAIPHILIVDDSITTRTLEKNLLESKNYKVTVAVNGKEAWDLLQKNTYSLIITDVMMPIMDGFALTERVKQSEKLQDIPVIIVTSLGSDNEKKRGIEVGADAYVVKSEFESGKLLDLVEQLV